MSLPGLPAQALHLTNPLSLGSFWNTASISLPVLAEQVLGSTKLSNVPFWQRVLDKLSADVMSVPSSCPLCLIPTSSYVDDIAFQIPPFRSQTSWNASKAKLKAELSIQSTPDVGVLAHAASL